MADEQKPTEPCPCRFIMIPEVIIVNHKLGEGAKILFGDIVSLASVKGYCYMTNANFGKRYGIDESTVTRWISNLVTEGLVTRELVYGSNSQCSERRLYINMSNATIGPYVEWYRRKCGYPLGKNAETPLGENAGKNNLSDDNNKLNMMSVSQNTLELSAEEQKSLIVTYGEGKVSKEIEKYLIWKRMKGAQPKSDYESFRQWLIRSATTKHKKPDVVDSGVDDISPDELYNCPF